MRSPSKMMTRSAFRSKTLDSLRKELGIRSAQDNITSRDNNTATNNANNGGTSAANRKHRRHQDEIVLNRGTDNEIKLWGYKESLVRMFVTLVAVVATCGALGLVLYWVEKLWLYATCQRCSLAEATKVLIMDDYKDVHTSYYVKHIKLFNPDGGHKGNGKENKQAKPMLRYFNFKKKKYIWDPVASTFHELQGLEHTMSLAQMQDTCEGISEAEAAARRMLYGANTIEVPVHSIPALLIKEILTPFYVFQVFSVCLWYADNYWLYASAIVVTSIVSLTAALYNTRTNQQNLRDTIVSSEMVTVFRPDGTKQDLMSTQVVPGDVIAIPDHGCQMHCDAVLLEGQAIMNESMLTGESVPVTKSACMNENVIYDPKGHEKHTLKCGTEVIQTRKFKGQIVKAVVIRTGYLTTKGDLVRSILYPPPVDFHFEKDSYKFVLFLAMMATVGMVYTLIKMIIDEETWQDIVLEVFDLITIVVPPALPAAMTIGVIIAQRRLKKKEIYCISPRTINVSGSIDCVCFDKTGTITEDGMDMWGVIPSKIGLTSVLNKSSSNSATAEQGPSAAAVLLNPVKQVAELSMDSEMRVGMAVCHELNVIEGDIMGDPLEEKIFEFTDWKLELEGDEHSQVDKFVMPFVQSPKLKDGSYIQAAPQRVMEFSSDSQCMSVICRVFKEEQEGEFSQPECIIFTKGSPEKMKRLCRPETLPDDYSEILDDYASQGFRILALASRHIPPNAAKNVKLSKLERPDIECDLTFLGLIVMENRIKTASSDVLKELHGANIRPIMVTGDNILTAVSVSKNCGLVKPGIKLIRVIATVENEQNENPSVEFVLLDDSTPPDKKEDRIDFGNAYYFVMDGATFETIATYYKDDLLPYIAARGAVFARMRPNMKQQLVEILQELDYFVAMCGDGANDCGALKAAHAGISLSEAEASVASPFTSKIADISCVPQLIREGRTALVTSFGIFKYMAGYSITQFVSVMILYEIYSNLSDTQYLYIDMFIITSLAAFFGLNRSYSGPLAKCAPEKSLISFLPLFSLISQLLICIAFQVIALTLVKAQPWFVGFDYKNPCYVNTTAETEFTKTLLVSDEYCTPESDPVASYENYTVFSVSQFQYIILAVAFSKGYPYRKSVLFNIPFMLDALLLIGFCIYLVLGPAQVFINAFILGFELFLPNEEFFPFRVLLLGIALANALVAIFCESVVCDRFVKQKVIKHDSKFEKLEKFLEAKKDWPYMSAASSPHKPLANGGNSAKDNQVIVTDQGVSAANDALNSLFSTPSSICHASAAVHLNPPPYSPRRLHQAAAATAATMSLYQSSADSTPMHKNNFDSAFSSPRHTATETDSSECNSKFVSCNSVLVDTEHSNNIIVVDRKADESPIPYR